MKLILLASETRSSNILYNSIAEHFEINNVIIEKPINKITFLKVRHKKVGMFRFIDQILFLVILNKILFFFSRNRIQSLLKKNKLNSDEIPSSKIINVKSANSKSTIDLINMINADVIIVSGTRILSPKLIKASKARIINIHAGITPDYRGVHGAYWAIVNKDNGKIGVTLHYIDDGVDTGKVISQAIIEVNTIDNFSTYPLIQLSKGIDLIKSFLRDYNLNKKTNNKIIGDLNNSKQWYHPGFFEYLYYKIRYGFK